MKEIEHENEKTKSTLKAKNSRINSKCKRMLTQFTDKLAVALPPTCRRHYRRVGRASDS